MSKLAPTSIKYVIKAEIDAKGTIERPDVIGAVFGQTEGLLGSDLDLRELQRTGRIGRLEVKINSKKGRSHGEIRIPSSLDSAETSLIAATLETIERIGPCTAKINLKSVEDTRELKRKFVVDKAKEILKELLDKGIGDSSKVAEDIKEEIKTYEITKYHGLPCGPNLLDSDEIIVVEGRADVITLVKYGIKNVVAMQGSSIPNEIAKLTKEKITTTFLDGDRGGSLNLKSLLSVADIDYIATAPEGKEVEELSKKEVFKALREKTSTSQFKLDKKGKNGKAESSTPPVKPSSPTSMGSTPQRSRNTGYRGSDRRGDKRDSRGKTGSREKKESMQEDKEAITEESRKIFKKTLDDLIGTRAACIFDSEFNILGKVPVKELESTLDKIDNPYAVVFDGKINYDLNRTAAKKDIKFLVGMEKENIKSSVNIFSKEDFT